MVKSKKKIAQCDEHYCDNQGRCHNCGILMELDWWDWYINGDAKEKALKSPKKKVRKP